MALQYYDFGNNIGYIINRTAKAFVGALDSQLREKVGVTAGQWKVLAVLVDRDGLTQKEIAERLALDGATLIPIIDKMEKDKLVVRKVDPADRRNFYGMVTTKACGLGTVTLPSSLSNKKRKNVWDLIGHSASMYYRLAFCMRDAFMNYSVSCLYSCVGLSHSTCIQKTKSHKSYKG